MEHFVGEAIRILPFRGGPAYYYYRFSGIYVGIGEANKGITYSNVDVRKSVVVIGWTTSKAEYMNSLSHEMLHVVQHISEQFLINMYGEDACYLLGGLVQACIRKG